MKYDPKIAKFIDLFFSWSWVMVLVFALVMF